MSNHNSFRAFFDKTASVYFVWKTYLQFSIGIGTLAFPMQPRSWSQLVKLLQILPARRYASAVPATALCLSVSVY